MKRQQLLVASTVLPETLLFSNVLYGGVVLTLPLHN